MGKFLLRPFQSDSELQEIQLQADIQINDEFLYLSYRLENYFPLVNLGNVNSSSQKKREMKLWENTCFEAMIKIPNLPNREDSPYLEFNFSPHFAWNVFSFPGKRPEPVVNLPSEYKGIKAAHLEIEILQSLPVFMVMISIKKVGLPKWLLDTPPHLWEIGLSAVLLTNAEKDLKTSYWAYHHADHRPNFHHFNSFKCRF